MNQWERIKAYFNLNDKRQVTPPWSLVIATIILLVAVFTFFGSQIVGFS